MKSRIISGHAAGSRRRPPAGVRPALYVGMAAAGALLVNVLVGAGPAPSAAAHGPQSVSVAERLGLTASSSSADVSQQLQPLEDLTATRNSRETVRSAAQQAQAAAVQAELDRRKAEAAQAVAAAQAAAAAQQAAAAAQQASANGHVNSAAAAGTAATKVAKITNTLGPVQPKTQTAANAIVTNVPGADAITIGGTRPDTLEPNGHPAGLALDFMVQSNTALGKAIVQYCIVHWNQLGLSYLIYQQHILMSPNGSWQAMEDRGSPTANHMDHVHVNLAR
jgi:hypothetical protein